MMSNNSELVAELVVHNAHCVISGYLGACLFTLRGCAPLFGAALARWSELTRAQALPKTARDLVRTRADDIFSEWCMRSEGLLEARAACAWCDTPVWEYCAPVALTPGARLLSEIARTFEARRNVRATLLSTRRCDESRRACSQAMRDCKGLPLRVRKRYRGRRAKCQASTNATICSQLHFANAVFRCTLFAIGLYLQRRKRLAISSTQAAVSRGEVNQYTDESFARESYLRNESMFINTSTRNVFKVSDWYTTIPRRAAPLLQRRTN